MCTTVQDSIHTIPITPIPVEKIMIYKKDFKEMDNYVIHTLHSKQSRSTNTSTYIFICTSVSTLISIYNIINSERTKEYSRVTNTVSSNWDDLFSIKAPGDIWIRVSCTKTPESNRVCFKYILISRSYKNNRRTCDNRLRNRKIIEVLQKY